MPRLLTEVKTQIEKREETVSLEEYLSTVLSKLLEQKYTDTPLNAFKQIATQVKQSSQRIESNRGANPYAKSTGIKNQFTGLKLKSDDYEQSREWAKRHLTLINPPPPPKKYEKVIDDDGNEIDQEVPDEEKEPEEEEENPDPYDLLHHFKMLAASGLGLTEYEQQALILSMYRLRENDKKKGKSFINMRFFGKITGSSANYYVLEVEEEPKIEEDQVDDQPKDDDDADKDNDDDTKEKEEEYDEEIKELFRLGSNRKNIQKILSEMYPVIPMEKREPEKQPFFGCNRYVYYVTTSNTFPAEVSNWVRLPDVEPKNILQARSVKRYFTGDLSSKVITHPPFEGDEKVLLRAQIARISAATKLAPKGYFEFESEQAEEEEEDEDGDPIKKTDHLVKAYEEVPSIKRAEDFTPAKLNLAALENWVHSEPMILHSQGRMTFFKPEEDENADGGEEDEEEGEDAKKKDEERIPPLLTPVTMDEFQSTDNGYRSWVVRKTTPLLLSYHPQASTIVSLRSLRWPGAYTVAENIPETGIQYANIYIGDGMKAYSSGSYSSFTPAFAQSVQTEYVVDEETLDKIENPKLGDRKEQLSRINLKKSTVLIRENKDIEEPEDMIKYKEPPKDTGSPHDSDNDGGDGDDD